MAQQANGRPQRVGDVVPNSLISSFCIVVLLGLAVFVPALPRRMSLGGAGFMAVGAAVSEAASGFVHGSIVGHVVAGALGAAVAGVLVHRVLRALDGMSFAIVTFAFSVIMTELSHNAALYLSTHRTGLNIAPPPSAIECVLVIALCAGICKAAANSWFAYGAGALAAGVAGAVLPSYVARESTTLIVLLCLAVSVAVIGGRRSALGPLAGALIMCCALPLVHVAGSGGPIVAGILLIAAFIWLPDGVLEIAKRAYASFNQRRADGAA